MDQQTYHVLLEGRTVGPYDRRTIVGMRIKRMLTGDQLLVAGDGTQVTVRELIGALPESGAPASRPAGSGRVRATYGGMVIEASGRGFDIPRFKGEVEVRLRTDVLRLAGRYRKAFGWKDGRIKLPLNDVVHARAKGPRTDVWLQRPGSTRLQRLGLYMFTSEAAEELAAGLAPPPSQAAHPLAAAARTAAAHDSALPAGRVLVTVVGALVVVVGLVLLALLHRRI